MNKPAAARGFTLIEVMVALAIVAITLGAGIRAAGALTNNTERLAQVSQAQWCAENQLVAWKLAGVNRLPDVGDSDFNCEQLGNTYRGKMIVRQTANPNFRRMDAQVNTESGDTLITLSTVVGRY